VGKPHGQRTYECPICFCWHNTSKENWTYEFVTIEAHESAIRSAECNMRTIFNERLAEKNREINRLQLKIKRLKRGEDEDV